MKKSIINPTKEQIEDYLAKIGWRLVNYGCGHYRFYNYKNKPTSLMFWVDRIEIEAKNYDETPCVCFYLKETRMEFLEKNCICFSGIRDKSIFLQCRNYKTNTKEKI